MAKSKVTREIFKRDFVGKIKMYFFRIQKK